MFGIPPLIFKQAFFWSATVIIETTLGLPLWVWALVFFGSGYMLYRDYRERHGWQAALPFFTEQGIFQLLSDHITFLFQPGNGWCVVRLIANAQSIDEIEEYYHRYMSSQRRHLEVDVVVARFWMGVKLQPDKKSMGEWWFEGKDELKGMGYADRDFDKATDRLPKSILNDGNQD